MDTQRILQFFALGLVLVLIWTAWQEDYGAGTPEETVAEEDAAEAPADAPAEPADPEAPSDDDDTADEPSAAEEETPATASGDRLERGDTVRVRTDKLDVELSTRGGEIRQVDLLQHFRTLEGEEPLRLMSDRLDELFIAQIGLLPREGDGPGPQSTFSVEETEYELGDDEDTIEIPMVWENDDGVRVTRRYIFSRDSYVVEVRHEVENASDADWSPFQYAQLRSGEIDDGTSWFIYTYTGGVVHGEEERYDKVSFSDMRSSDLARDLTDGYAAMLQHYFVGAWIPPRGERHTYYTRSLDNNQYLLGMSSPRKTIAAGSSGTFEHKLWVGPKEQDRLAEVAEGLDLTVDYGWLTIISKPLFIALSWIHGVVGNWGWAIVILTLGIKLVFYKLSETSYRSMARMRKLQPRMQQLKERYGDDRQAMNQAMMKMYKEEKINPLGGCLPILVQIPVFIALYWVLLESVELRHAPFILWINDLSSPDPYFVLPLIMGASMLLQQKLNPAPMDPIQQKIMMALPVVFTVFFMFFPAGLVLYWVANNVLSIAQQWFITRRIERGESE